MSTEKEVKVGTCPICEINVYDRGGKNKPFKNLGRTKMGYPRDIAMPCGMSRPEGLCPFETKEQQDKISYERAQLVFSGKNMWD